MMIRQKACQSFIESLVQAHKANVFVCSKNYKFCSTETTNSLDELKQKTKINWLFEGAYLQEEDYSRKIDLAFRAYPVILPLQDHEEKELAIQFNNLLNFLCSKKETLEVTQSVSPTLLKWIKDRTFNVQKDHSLKIERQISTSTSDAKGKQESSSNSSMIFKAENRGHLQIFGVGIDRDANEYFHKYIYERTGGDLHFKRRVTSQEKLANMDPLEGLPKELQGKSAQMRKQIEELATNNAQQDKDKSSNSGFKGALLDVAKKFGYDFKAGNDIDGRDYARSVLDIKKQAHQTINTQKQQYILVEDFHIKTSQGLQIKTLGGDIIWQDTPDESGLFHHFIRTEALCDVAQAQSLKNQRKRFISDIDAALKGNPPAKVKQFAD